MNNWEFSDIDSENVAVRLTTLLHFKFLRLLGEPEGFLIPMSTHELNHRIRLAASDARKTFVKPWRTDIHKSAFYLKNLSATK